MSTTAAPQLSSLHRVQSIPIVNDALSSLHAILLQNALTAWPYATAQSLSHTAYSATTPIQNRLVPVLVPFDGLANKGLDFVEQRYPYPFQTPTDTIAGDIKRQRDQIVEVAVKTYDARIKSPVYGLAHGADQTITPVVDVLQLVHDKLNTKTDGPVNSYHPNGAGPETQVHRAVRLGLGLKDQVLVLSAEQLHQLQAHSVVVQRLTDALYNLNALVASTITGAKDKGTAVTKDGYARAHALVEAAGVEIEKISQTLRALPAHLQQNFQPIQSRLTQTGDALSSVLRSEAPASEKASQAIQTLKEEIPELVEMTVKTVREGLSNAIVYVHSAASKAPTTGNNKSASTPNGGA